jgi:hypothetical protein
MGYVFVYSLSLIHSELHTHIVCCPSLYTAEFLVEFFNIKHVYIELVISTIGRMRYVRMY